MVSIFIEIETFSNFWTKWDIPGGMGLKVFLGIYTHTHTDVHIYIYIYIYTYKYVYISEWIWVVSARFWVFIVLVCTIHCLKCNKKLELSRKLHHVGTPVRSIDQTVQNAITDNKKM